MTIESDYYKNEKIWELLKAIHTIQKDQKEKHIFLSTFELSERFSLLSQDIDFGLKNLESAEVIKIKAIDKHEADGKYNEDTTVYTVEIDDKEFDNYAQKIKNLLEGKSAKTIRIKFDRADSTLYINDKPVELQIRNAGSNQAKLCEVLFANKETLNRYWHTEEILELWKWPDYKIHDKAGKFLRANRHKTYFPAKAINNLISKATDGLIPDLLDFTTHGVTVREKYRDNITLE